MNDIEKVACKTAQFKPGNGRLWSSISLEKVIDKRLRIRRLRNQSLYILRNLGVSHI